MGTFRMSILQQGTQVLPIGDTADPSKGSLSDIDLLHSISVALIGEQDRFELYGKIVEAAVAITGSQFGTMQLLCPIDDPSGHGGELQLLAHRGLPSEAVGFWQWVNPRAYSSCTLALKFGQRAIIPDFEEWEDIAGTPDLAAFRKTGIRSAQALPRSTTTSPSARSAPWRSAARTGSLPDRRLAANGLPPSIPSSRPPSSTASNRRPTSPMSSRRSLATGPLLAGTNSCRVGVDGSQRHRNVPE